MYGENVLIDDDNYIVKLYKCQWILIGVEEEDTRTWVARWNKTLKLFKLIVKMIVRGMVFSANISPSQQLVSEKMWRPFLW